jgi:MFS family permease
MSTKEKDRLDPALLKLAGILILGGIAPFLDTTIVNVALDRLGRDLHTSVATIQWVSTGYLLALAMAVPVTGWAVQRFGAKRMWLISLTVFLAGSALSGLAWDVGSLIGFRVLQGIGGGLMSPILQTLLVRAGGPRRIGRILTVVTLVAVVAPILGPVVGGLIIGNAGWRWIFYVNVPLCVLAFVLAWRGLPETPAQGRSRLDVKGLALLSPAMAAIVYGLSQAGTQGGFAGTAVLVPLVGGVLLLVSFVVHTLRRRERPLLDVRLFRVPSFAASAAGLLLAPQGIGSLLTRWAGGLTDRLGARPIVLGGLLLATLGTVADTQVGPHTSEWLLAGSLVVRGAGLGAATVSIVAGAYHGLTPQQVPDASSITRIVQQLGGSFGTAVLAVILQRATLAHASTGLAGHAAAFGQAFWWSLGFTILAFVPALFLSNRPSHKVV